MYYRAWLVGTGVLISIAVVAAAGLYLLEYHGSREQHNPSFRYGQRLMDDVVYGHLHLYGKSVEQACSEVVQRRVGSPPSALDVGRAVSGCRYEKYIIDS